MQKRIIFTILGLASLIVACGERFDYRHKYVGDFEIDTRTEQTDSNGWYYDTHFVGEVYAAGEDRLVIRYDSVNALDFQVDKKGNLTLVEPKSNYLGKFQDADHFSWSESYYTFDLDPMTFTLSGVRASK